MKFMNKVFRTGFERFAPYFSLLKPVKKQFIIGILMGVLYGLASGAGLPYLTKVLIPVLTAKPLPDTLILIGYISIFPVGMFLRAVCGYFNTYLMAYCGTRVLLRLRSNVMGRLQELPLSFYHENTVGDLMARVTGDTGALQQVLTQVSNDLIKQPVTLVAAVGYLIFLAISEREASFLLMFLATVPLIILPLRIFGKRVLKRAKQVQNQSGDISNYVSENLNAVREVRAFNLQQSEMARFDQALENFATYSMKVVKYSKIIRPTIEVVGVVCVTGAVVYMLQRDIFAIAASMLVALYVAYEPVKKFGEIHVLFKRGRRLWIVWSIFCMRKTVFLKRIIRKR
ncbi:ABC transporter ATP-binding protein [Verrucomicrobia bacterium S94]|nr:ABC transporter ATP-binding protein [Verrucomicrobia bacterium S94]